MSPSPARLARWTDTSAAGPWRTELIDVVRAASGGLLFGVPLLYTMEVWWAGSHTSAEQMGLLLFGLLVPVLVLNQTAGFRSTRDVRLRDAAADTIEAVAIGLVVTAAVLALLRQITIDTPASTALGKVLYESVPFCLGIGVARHFLHGSRSSGHGAGGGETTLHATVADLGATVIGAAFVALSIAPTDEVPMIASAMSPSWLLLVVASSLVISFAIVFLAGFSRQDQRHEQRGIFQSPASETVAAYLLSLLVAAVLLALFQRGLAPWPDLLARVVVLGLPAAVGGAAGRLAL